MDTLTYFAHLTADAKKWTVDISPLSPKFVGMTDIYYSLVQQGVLCGERVPARIFISRVIDVKRMSDGRARLDYAGDAKPLTYIRSNTITSSYTYGSQR